MIKGTEGSFPSTYLGGMEPLFLDELFILPRRMDSQGQLVGKIAVKAAKTRMYEESRGSAYGCPTLAFLGSSQVYPAHSARPTEQVIWYYVL